MALIVGQEHPRLVQSDEIGQTARMLRQRHAKEVEENAKKAAERKKRLDAEAAKKKADFEALQAQKEAENVAGEQSEEKESPKVDDSEEVKEEVQEPVQSSSIIDGSQIKLPPKKKANRKPKTKK